jgi:hypothetical protein
MHLSHYNAWAKSDEPAGSVQLDGQNKQVLNLLLLKRVHVRNRRH